MTRRDETRIDLATQAPIPTPATVQFELTTRCTLGCKFCVTGHGKTPPATMSLDMAKGIIDQFAEYPDRVRLFYFQGLGESLLHPDFCEIVAYARSKDVSDWYELRTNGTLLNPELNSRLVECGLDRIGISVNGLSDEDYWDTTQRIIDFEALVANIADLYAKRGDMELYAKIIDTGRTQEELDFFESTFAPISTEHQVEYLTDWPEDGYDYKLGIVTGKAQKGYALAPKRVCAFPFFMQFVQADGRLRTCCPDHMGQTATGSIEQGLHASWHGDALRDFRASLLTGKEPDVCARCTYYYTCLDDIDDAADAIRGRL